MVLHRTLPLKVSLYDTIIIVKTSPGGEKSEQPTVLSWNLTLLCFDMTETLSRTQIHKQLFSEFLGSFSYGRGKTGRYIEDESCSVIKLLVR